MRTGANLFKLVDILEPRLAALFDPEIQAMASALNELFHSHAHIWTVMGRHERGVSLDAAFLVDLTNRASKRAVNMHLVGFVCSSGLDTAVVYKRPAPTGRGRCRPRPEARACLLMAAPTTVPLSPYRARGKGRTCRPCPSLQTRYELELSEGGSSDDDAPPPEPQLDEASLVVSRQSHPPPREPARPPRRDAPCPAPWPLRAAPCGPLVSTCPA